MRLDEYFKMNMYKLKKTNQKFAELIDMFVQITELKNPEEYKKIWEDLDNFFKKNYIEAEEN